jgi:hypothetical protein
MAKRMVQVDADVLEALKEKVKAMEQLLTAQIEQKSISLKTKECPVCKCNVTRFSEQTFMQHKLECFLEHDSNLDKSQKPKPLCPSCKVPLIIPGKTLSHYVLLAQDLECFVCRKLIDLELEFGHCRNETNVESGLFVCSGCWLTVKK